MQARIEGFVVDHFYGGAVLKDVIKSCVASDTLSALREFMQARAPEFEAGSTEHKLEYPKIHQEYCALVESRLEAPLKKHGKTVEDFMGICKKLKEASARDFEEQLMPFIDVLLAATDYMMFAEIMLGTQEKRDYFFHILKGLQADLKRSLGTS